MKRFVTATLITGAFCVGVAAQGPPKPGPENKRLEVFAGSWKMETTMHPSPMGPGGKMTGTENCTMFEGGFSLTCDSSGSGPMGSFKGHSVMGWDAAAKKYLYFSINSMGGPEHATGTVSGKTWTWEGKSDIGGGKTVQSRFTLVETSPTVHNMKWDISEDGKTWKTLMEGTSTKSGT
jgi:hypothetical protein